MKQLICVLCFMCCQLCAQPFVFVTPIEQGKTDLIKQSQIFNSPEYAEFFQNLGISTYHCWIQKIHERDFLVHLFKGEDLIQSFELLKGRINFNDEMALQIDQVYREVLGVDLGKKRFFAETQELTPMLHVDVPKEEDVFMKGSCRNWNHSLIWKFWNRIFS